MSYFDVMFMGLVSARRYFFSIWLPEPIEDFSHHG